VLQTSNTLQPVAYRLNRLFRSGTGASLYTCLSVTRPRPCSKLQGGSPLFDIVDLDHGALGTELRSSSRATAETFISNFLIPDGGGLGRLRLTRRSDPALTLEGSVTLVSRRRGYDRTLRDVLVVFSRQDWNPCHKGPHGAGTSVFQKTGHHRGLGPSHFQEGR